jgi:Ca-activated chloride channel family protein
MRSRTFAGCFTAVVFLFTLCVAGAPAVASAAQGEPGDRAGSSPRGEAALGAVMLVLDASGSMWGQIEGRTKIEIAREVMGELLQDWDANIALGLMAYGHRRKGDCNDIEALFPVGQPDAAAMIQAMDAINPKGKTPLSEAVRRAAVDLRYTEERATVVLISDGVETCGADPCAVGAELAMAGVDFTAHVIGFDVKDEEQVGLRCLAEKTGGLFLAAADAEGLRRALSKTVEKAKEPPQPLIEEPGEASLEAPNQVPAGSAFEVRWEGPDSRNDFITLVARGAPEGSYAEYAYTVTGNPVTIAAPDEVGGYELRYVFDHRRSTLARRDVEVTPVQASLVTPASVAAGSVLKVDWEGPDNARDYVTIVPAGAGDDEYLNYAWTASGTPAAIQTPDQPGDYEARYITGQSRLILARARFTVTPVSATVKPPASVGAAADFQVEWTGPNNPRDYVTIVPAGASENEYLSYASTASGSPATLRAPVESGEYEVRYVLDQSRSVLARAKLTVTSVSATVEAPPSVVAGSEFQVVWQGPDRSGDYITIVPTGADEGDYMSYARTSSGSPATLRAPDQPGEYEVRYILDQSRIALARTPILVQ